MAIKEGDIVQFVEKIPQDDGKPALLVKHPARVIAVWPGSASKCEKCGRPRANHIAGDGKHYNHEWKATPATIDLVVNIPGRPGFPAREEVRNFVCQGEDANCWSAQ